MSLSVASKSLLGIFLICLCSSQLKASATWTQEEGWKAEGKLALKLESENPLEAKAALKLMNQAGRAEADKDHWIALFFYKRLIRTYPRSAWVPKAHHQRGRVYIRRNQFRAAKREFEIIFGKYPEYENINEVLSDLYQTAKNIQQGERSYIWGFIPWLQKESVAADLYESIISAAPFSTQAPRALDSVSKIYKKEPKKAIEVLNRLIATYPNSPLSAVAYLKLGELYESLGKGPAYDQESARHAASFYSDYLYLFPHGQNTSLASSQLKEVQQVIAQSKYLIADFYQKARKNPQSAFIFYHKAITVAPDSAVAAAAQEKIAAIGRRHEKESLDWKAAYKRFKNNSQEEFEGNLRYRFQTQFTENFIEAEASP